MNTSKLLIVDDERINLDFFDVMFTKLGFTVSLEEDGEAALALLESLEDEELPDLIILDNLMPRMTGWELTKLLKSSTEDSRYCNIPIIMFSAMDNVQDKIKGFELGIEDYITKPFNFSEVLSRVRAVLRNHELASQVLKREKRIAVSESLNQSFSYFTKNLEEPANKLILKAKKVKANCEDPEVLDFIDDVILSSEKLLASMDGLKDEVEELNQRQKAILNTEVSIENLDKKYLKHLEEYSIER